MQHMEGRQQRAALAPTAVVLALIAVYSLTFGALSILQHDHFGTSIYDLGNVDQAVWNTVHGRILQFTTQPRMGDIRLSMHIEPILLPISLLYLIYSSPKTLLVVQTLAIALGAWPLYLLARWRLKRAWPAAAFALAYLLLPTLQGANLFEFHAVVLAPLFLIFTFYEMERAIADGPAPGRLNASRCRLALLFSVLAMSCKEDIPLLVFAMGVYFLLARRSWRAALPLLLLGAAWFYAAIYVVFPLVRQGKGSPFLYYYRDLGDNPVSIALSLLTRPARFAEIVLTADNGRYLLGLLWPFGFLPLLGLPALLIATPSLAINLLSGFELMHELEAKQYAVPIAPFVAIAAVYGAARLARVIRREQLGAYLAAGLLLASAGSYHYLRGYSPLSQAFRLPAVTDHDRLAAEFIARIPPDAPLVAQDRLFPHVSQRERAYYVWTKDTDAEFIWLDVSHPSFVNVNDVHGWMRDQVAAQQAFGLVKAEDGYLLLQRGAPRRPLPDGFLSFIRVSEPRMAERLEADFGDTLRLLGFDVLYDRDREVRFVLYVQPLRAIRADEELRLSFELVDSEGRLQAATTAPQPALVWYPPERWQAGETLCIVANTLPWTTEGLQGYGIAVGVRARQAASETSLAPRLRASPSRVRFVNEGTAVELMQFHRVFGIQQGSRIPPEKSASAVARRLDARLGSSIRLEGATWSAPAAGGSLDVELVWRATDSITESYTVFVHLIDTRGKILAQKDSIPSTGTLPTTAWLPGDYIRDHYRLDIPADATPAALSLAVGLYQPDSGRRLEVEGAENAVKIPLD